ncbi:MAG: MarR family transcriptional regulator [Desulfomonile tiedjei]|nr:MarR family transcriptional regulator [Desulfomonile tiedjei]
MAPNLQIFPRKESPGFMIYRTATQMKGGLHRAFRAKGINVTPEQWTVLSSLWEADGMHQSVLACKAAKDKHTLTRILHLLEKAGLVRREAHLKDKRCRRVFLTEEGKGLKEKLVPVAADLLQSAFAGLTQEEIDTLRRILAQIMRNLGRNELTSELEAAGLEEDTFDEPALETGRHGG